MDAIQAIRDNLYQFKKKFFVNQLLKGTLIFLISIIASYLIFNTLEYFGNFNTTVRTLFFYGFFSILSILAYIYIGKPFVNLILLNKKLSDTEAAIQIGKLLPSVKDKLLNTLQLSNLNDADNQLINAAIKAKSNEVSVFNFSDSIHLKENNRFLKYLIPLIFLILVLLSFIPSFFTESTKRIVKYNMEFVPNAPFKFEIKNKNLKVYKNEDLTIEAQLTGNSIPEMVYIKLAERNQKMENLGNNNYSFTISNLTESIDFQLTAGGFFSDAFSVAVVSRPVLNGFKISLDYPNYTNKKDEIIENVGNIFVPEGTKVVWNFDATDCDKITFQSDSSQIQLIEKSLVSGFEIKKQVMKAGFYSVKLFNQNGEAKDKLLYNISVIADEFPKINAEQFKDSTLLSSITFGGNLADDYGLTKLKLLYRKSTETIKNELFKEILIPINNNQLAQNFYYRWALDSLNIKPNETLEYYFSVWDNDAIHGNKFTQSQVFTFKMPSQKDLELSIEQSSNEAESKLSATLNKAEQLKKDFKKLENKLKGKKMFDWQDKKSIEDMMQKHDEMQKEMEQLQEKHKEMTEKQDKFDKTSERIAEKSKLLQQLMAESLDDETKKLYQELHKLLAEKGKENEIKDIIEKITKKEENVEKELDRALEMFKQLKFEKKMEVITQNLTDLAKKQEELALKTEEKNANLEKIKEEQKELNEKFEETKKEMDELKKMNEELEDKQKIDDLSKEEQNVDKQQEESKDALDKNDKKKAAESQKKAADELNKMKEKMDAMQKSMESDALSENMEDLRNILENLITLSYDQEAVMKDFKNVNQQDPRYVTLSQQQLKLKDDSKIVEDSLNALARRVFQIQSFINRELESMNMYMDDASKAIKARRSDMAAGKQQFAMTSMNNLALLLSDVLKQMQEQSQDQKQQSGSCKKPSNKKGKKPGSAPSMSQMQKKLNKQIEDLKKSGSSGQKMSEELAKMMRQQEQIRKMMKGQNPGGKQQGGKSGKDGEKSGGSNGNGQGEEGGENGEMGKDGKPKNGKEGKPGKENGENAIDMKQLEKEMEETEKDLANKQISEQTIERQQKILGRLLEHEKAQREREEDPKREANSAKELPKKLPPNIENYLKEKEKQIELLKTISPSLNNYYKTEVNEYFEKISK